MADILRITTPLITKNPAQLQKQPDAGEVFSLQELTKVVKSNPQSELLRQNNGMIQHGENTSVLLDMLQDPSAAVGFLRNIFILQEIVGLLPLNNQTVTPEIRQMFEALFIPQEELVPEMIRQENSTTIFKGAFFDFIRDALGEGQSPELLEAALKLLKAVNGALDKRDVLDSVSNSLRFLSESLSSSRRLSEKLSELSARFRQPDAPEQLPALKAEIQPLFREIEGSVLFTPKLAKLLPLITYNLSRYSDSPDYLLEAAEKFFDLLENGEMKTEFADLLRSVLARPDSISSEKAAYDWGTASGRAEAAKEYSQVMDILTKIIGTQSEKDGTSPASKSRLEKVIYSLLSSPSNFTPLLHFILPVKHDRMNAFAELWINPNGEEDAPEGETGTKGGLHFLIVFDIGGVGQFEAELYVRDRTIDFNLFCPPEHLPFFAGLDSSVRQGIRDTGYRFGKVKIDKLVRTRSLIEVFTGLPYRRMGIDIRA